MLRNILIALVLFPFLSSGQTTQLLTNGGFATDLSSWTTSGNVAHSNFYSNGTAAFSEGNTAVDGIISQTFAVTSGQTLSIDANYARRGSTAGADVVEGLLEILDGTTVIYSATLTAATPSGTFTTTSGTVVATNSSLTVRFTDQTTNTTGRDFHMNTISITQPIPLPVDLLSFDATASTSGQVEITWATASEHNNDYFTLEKSQDGVLWNTLEIVSGAGTSSKILNYSTVDNNPFLNGTLYRLKQTDFDGQSEYSDVIVVKSSKNNDKVTAYPNPTKDLVSINGLSEENTKITVFDLYGVDVSSKIVQLKTSYSSVSLDLSSLSHGIYFIQTLSGTHRVQKE